MIGHRKSAFVWRWWAVITDLYLYDKLFPWRYAVARWHSHLRNSHYMLLGPGKGFYGNFLDHTISNGKERRLW